MKKIALIFGLLMITTGILNAQGDSTATFKVWGNCESCKSRIEKAAKAAGAITADWDEETKMISVSFNPANSGLDKIQQKIALAGHDTEKYKALANAYNKLPGCCKYERAPVEKMYP